MKNPILLITFLSILFSCQPPKQETLIFQDFVNKLEEESITERQGLVDTYLTEIESTPLIEGKEKVHFIWYGSAGQVQIEGNLQRSWTIPDTLTMIDCGENDLFYISYTLPSDALLEYNFIADGERLLDLRNPQISESIEFGDHSLFWMPDFVESPNVKVRFDIKKGKINRYFFRTKHPKFANRILWIYTPYGYSENKKYPVVYVNDGMWAMYTSPFVHVVNNLIHEKKIEPIVVVFVPFADRWSEYVTQSDEYAKLMVDGMIPFIEENFQVATSPEKRGIVGASAGAHGAIVTALRHSDIFANVASQGGGAGGSPDLDSLANLALDIYLIRKDQFPLKHLYTEVGNYDLEFPDRNIRMIDGVRQFHERLKEYDIDHIYKEINSGHISTSWNQRIEDILILFFGK